MRQERFLIFGTGFVAKSYFDHLKGLDISDLSIKVIFNEHKLAVDDPTVEHIPMGGSQISSCLESFKPTRILCLHGSSFVPAGTKVRDSMEENALKTMDFLEIISQSESRKNLKNILVVGSASEYGKYYNEAILEDFPLHATSLYGLSKICLYNASMYYFDRGLPIVHIRQFNTIGPAQRECFVLPSFCRQIVEIEKGIREPVIMVGDLTQERDFIDIRDTCRAYSLLFQKGIAGEVYNVASGEYVTIQQLLDLILDCSEFKGDLEVRSKKGLFFVENRLSHRLHADISKIKSLGFNTEYTLRDTIMDTLGYWREHV